MEREQNTRDPANEPNSLTDIWRLAEQRRAEDLGAWLSTFLATFVAKRQLTAKASTNPYPTGQPRPV